MKHILIRLKIIQKKLLDNYLAPEQQVRLGKKLNHLSTEMGTVIKSIITRTEELGKYFNNLESKLLEDNSISEIISCYKTYLDTLSIMNCVF